MDVRLLPETFLSAMRELLGEEYEDYLACFDGERLYGLRVNTLKIRPEEFAGLAPFHLRPIPWIPNGFYYDGERDRPAKHPYYYAGLYYLQEPSAMTPAMVLDARPGDMVLDLCAAPGGKSTELGAALEGEGMLFSNDISNTRAKALLKNLELAGVSNFCVSSEEPKKLAAAFPEYFDKILVDAPCSGEGMFRKDPDMIKSWTERGPEAYVPIQREILSMAARMLKPGGRLVYSTCTFDRRENEDNIRWLLDEYPGLRPDLKAAQRHGEKLPENLISPGMGLSGCIRLFPHKIGGEGHFIAVLEKQGREEGAQDLPAGEGAGSRQSFPLQKYPEAQEFLRLIRRSFDPKRLTVRGDSLYYLPEGFKEAPGIRYLRTGLLLGNLKRGRFEPSQALAMALKKEEFSQSFNLPCGDERVIKYLKGETIACGDEKKGWQLVCADGFPLGFAKGNGLTLKNKYYPGWRWQ